MSKYGSAIVRLVFLAVLVAAIGFFASQPVHAQTSCLSECATAYGECVQACGGPQGGAQCLSNCRMSDINCIECCDDPNCNPD